jgi:hypothetical protein
VTAQDAVALLEAGAILPDKAAGDAAVDTITARTYHHPALDGREVVRLVPGALGEAEDLSMEFLGFTAAAEPVPVGQGRRLALGFPAWALVHDPANGRHALALVKEMERLARVAKSKPGNAKDGYDELADRLGAAAPHFLPTFWEQAGRAFMAAENGKAAGTCFAAARRAEQVHGLAVDEDRLRDVHLEFAFAGALTAKAVSEYARQVADRREPADAFRLVRDIALQRVAGGLPPYVGMADDLKRLARAAGLHPDTEADAVLAELLRYPAMAKAHEGVWKAYRPALVRLAKRDPAVRGALLTMMPDPPGYDTDFTDGWLDLLDATGAAEALRAPGSVPEAARSPDGVAGWVQRFVDRRDAGWWAKPRSPRWLALLERLVDGVRAELVAAGRQLRLGRDSGQVDLDVLDACLAVGVPVQDIDAVTSPHYQFRLDHWSRSPAEGRRDLVAVAADRRFIEPLIRAVVSTLDAHSDGFSHARRQAAARNPNGMLAIAGLRAATQAWLTRMGEQLDSAPTVLALANVLDVIAPLWNSAGVAVAPRVFSDLASADHRAALARTLMGGFMTELAWPDYEKAHAELTSPSVTESWPEIVLADEHRVIVIGPEGAIVDHTIRVPPGITPRAHSRLFHVDGQVMVAWRKGAYWSGRPTEVFPPGDPKWKGFFGTRISLGLPQGGRTTGGRPWRVDDTDEPERYHIVSDGSSYWRCEMTEQHVGYWDAAGYRWREYDPATGASGRFSTPAFLDVLLPDGDLVAPQWCSMHPAPDAYAASPLGWRDGLVGWRVVRHADGSLTGNGIDDRAVHLQTNIHGTDQLVGALRLPGDETPRPVTVNVGGHRIAGDTVTLWDVEGKRPVSQWLTGATLPPPQFWHALRPREERASAALRAADAALAARLLEPCAAAGPDDLLPTARRAVGEALPEVSDDHLVEAVALAVAGAEQVRRLQVELADLVSAEPGTDVLARELDADTLREALSGLSASADTYLGHLGPDATVSGQIAAVGRLLADPTTDGPPVPKADTAWADALPWLGAVALRAASPATADEHRSELARLLRAVSAIDIGGAARLRVLQVSVADGVVDADGAAVIRTPTSTFVILGGPTQYVAAPADWVRMALEFSATGEFAVPPKVTVKSEAVVAGWGDRSAAAAVAALVDQRGPAPWRPEAVDRLVAGTGMSRAEAALLLAALPGLHTWQANFLDADVRALLGLKTTEARAARTSLSAMPSELRSSLVAAAMPAEPEDLWRHGPDVDAVVAVWRRHFGQTVAVPDGLVTEAARVLGRHDAADVLRTIASPQPGGWLHTDGVTEQDDWHLRMTADTGRPFDSEYLDAVAIALPWLTYRLPAGDPIRAAVPAAYELVRQRLLNPSLFVGETFRTQELPLDGLDAVELGVSMPTWKSYVIRPARLTGADDPALVFTGESVGISLRLLLSERFMALVAAIAADPTPAGRFPHDPRVSVPDLVAAVAAAHGLDDDAAAYYLQLLALPDPTDRRVAEWNQWSTAALKAVRARLAATDLVVEAKRERAGRSLFLPGGWLALKSPDLPLEAWKAGLPLGLDGSLPGARVLVPTTVADLFRAAWQRVTDGDAPRYHSLSEKR